MAAPVISRHAVIAFVTRRLMAGHEGGRAALPAARASRPLPVCRCGGANRREPQVSRHYNGQAIHLSVEELEERYVGFHDATASRHFP